MKTLSEVRKQAQFLETKKTTRFRRVFLGKIRSEVDADTFCNELKGEIKDGEPIMVAILVELPDGNPAKEVSQKNILQGSKIIGRGIRTPRLRRIRGAPLEVGR